MITLLPSNPLGKMATAAALALDACIVVMNSVDEQGAVLYNAIAGPPVAVGDHSPVEPAPKLGQDTGPVGARLDRDERYGSSFAHAPLPLPDIVQASTGSGAR